MLRQRFFIICRILCPGFWICGGHGIAREKLQVVYGGALLSAKIGFCDSLEEVIVVKDENQGDGGSR